MTDPTTIRDLLGRVVADPPPASFEPADVLRAGRARTRHRRLRAVVAAAAGALVVVVGVGLAGGGLVPAATPRAGRSPLPGASSPTAVTPRACPHDRRGSGGFTAEIDWVDLVRFGGVQYQAAQDRNALPEPLLGDPVGAVRCRLEGNVGDPSYRLQEGDAAYLDPGTTLYAVTGYRLSFRIAVRTADGLRLYEAAEVPTARRGEDVLDLRGKVTRIDLVDGDTGERVLRTVDDRARVTRLVDLLLDAPTVGERSIDEAPVFLRFELRDGTWTQRAWFVRSGVVDRTIRAPAELRQVLAP